MRAQDYNAHVCMQEGQKSEDMRRSETRPSYVIVTGGNQMHRDNPGPPNACLTCTGARIHIRAGPMCAKEKKRARMTGREDRKDMKEKNEKKPAGANDEGTT